MSTETTISYEIRQDDVVEFYKTGQFERLDELLRTSHPADLASLIEGLPREIRTPIWERIPKEYDGEVLVELSEEVRSSLVAEMDPEELAQAAQDLDADDLIELLEPLSDETSQSIIESLDDAVRVQFESNMQFDDDDAGRLMRYDAIVVKAGVTLEVVQRFLRRKGELPDHTDCLMVIDAEGEFIGVLKLEQLLLRPIDTLVDEIILRDFDTVGARWHEDDVARLFERHDLISVPVLDEQGSLLGRITIDDVVDIIREQADEALFARVGMDGEEDLFAPAVSSAKRRAVWLGINLLTAVLAAWVIDVFSGTIEQLVALAVLMPIVASMGGISGSQTLTLTIRGISTGQLHGSNVFALLRKEVSVGLFNGLLWACAIGLLAMAWFSDLALGLVIAAAIALNLSIASLAGVTIPLLLKKFGSDPALSGAVILTTVTDVVGFLSFLGLATLFLI